MNSTWSVRVLTAGVTAGLALVAATPALAAPNPGINGSAFAVSVRALNGTIIKPTPTVTLPADGTAQNKSSVPVTLPGLLTVELLNARTSGDPAAGTSTATGSVANVAILPTIAGLTPAALSANAISATCSATLQGVTGSASLVNLRAGVTPIGLANPGPNTIVAVPGFARVVLNEQIVNAADRSLTVNALHAQVGPNGSIADIILGSATCGPNAIAPAISAFPTAGLPIAGGLVAVFVLGAVALRRRQNHSLAA